MACMAWHDWVREADVVDGGEEWHLVDIDDEKGKMEKRVGLPVKWESHAYEG